ncbi:hypothetical protein QJS10_CPA09g01968 [Acorus calamus]|uniref:MHD1 domain-containing protein n=1 Tax=Acorus calamus TaxID=4465 RepID=A0AAV9E3L6_ACOCL|nr:hypothetical protein QJS10_CPA09g01968 [Acorus calamus]
MGSRRLSIGGSSSFRSDVVCAIDREAEWPFGRVDSLDRDNLRETAYELFFASCRASPVLCAGRNHPVIYYPDAPPNASGDGPRPGVGMVGTSRIKRALGLRPAAHNRRPSQRRAGNRTPIGSMSPNPMMGRARRPMTSAELMRQQMRVSEQSDKRLRKTLLRTLLGQAGLVLHPSVPLDRTSNPHVARLHDIVRTSEIRPVDTGRGSDAMKTLCSSVIALAWRTQSDACHWADGSPLNVHLYLSLLQSVFDVRDETLVVDEVDELVELMRKTWPTLGMNRALHNLCFAWVLFQQFVTAGRAEQDLLGAALAMLEEVASDAKKGEYNREGGGAYVKVLASAMASMQGWAEKSVLDYHECFGKGGVGLMECVLSLALSTSKILEPVDPVESRVDYYIRSSLRNAFNKVLEIEGEEGTSESLVALATETEELVLREKEHFSPTLKRWHPTSAAVAAVTLHNCYGSVLKQYLSGVTTLTNDVIRVLNTAGKLEKVLVQMVDEDIADCDDGGKSIMREMLPYEIESIVLGLIKTWIDERLKRGRECLSRAKDTETWSAMSKMEPHAQSAVELMNLAKETVEEFFEIPVGMRDDLVQDLADGWEGIVRDYTSFMDSCGSKQSYIPTLPPLTRCNHDLKIRRLCMRAATCNAGYSDHNHHHTPDNEPRPTMSRGTHRLYVRLNTLYYLLTHLHHLDNTLSPRFPNSHRRRFSTTSTTTATTSSSSYFETARSSIQSSIHHVSEVAAYRLVFLDCNHAFYETLYRGDVASARVHPALRALKQNLTLMTSILTDKSQPLAVKEVMKASFEAFMMVLLAGGGDRAFSEAEQSMVAEDLGSLKRVFAVCGEGVVAEEVVEKEAEVVEGVVGLMGMGTVGVIEGFKRAAWEGSGMGMVVGEEKVVPMPPTTGRWNREDPNTVLRVLCHRDDVVADRFLKKAFQLPKSR